MSEIVAYEPTNTVTVLPPESGIVGAFLEQTANMFKARAMRMNGLLRRIDEAGQRTESLLQDCGGTYGGSRAALQEQFNREGLVHGMTPSRKTTSDTASIHVTSNHIET